MEEIVAESVVSSQVLASKRLSRKISLPYRNCAHKNPPLGGGFLCAPPENCGILCSMTPRVRRILLGGLGALAIIFLAIISVRALDRALIKNTADDAGTAIANALTNHGASVEHVEATARGFSSLRAVTVTFNGDRIDGFIYDTASTAETLARLFSSDAKTLGGNPIQWVAAPHIYLFQNVIILYLGSSPYVLTTLNKTFGNQIAGQ